MNVRNIAKKVVRSLKKSNVTLEDEYIDRHGLKCFNGYIAEAIGIDSSAGWSYVTELEKMLSAPVKYAINNIHRDYAIGQVSFTKAKKQVLEVLDDIPNQ